MHTLNETDRLFIGAWMRALFMHYEIEPAVLQPTVPFELDVRNGKAYVSLVAFTQERLRFEFGGRLTAWVGALTANHPFLNVRTYVRVGENRGIYFLAEWVPQRLAQLLGPPLFGLPYRLGRLEYAHTLPAVGGMVIANAGRFAYRGTCAGEFRPCPRGSLDEFLLERYAAFTQWHGVRRMFRVEHEPWPQREAEVMVDEDGLLRAAFPWWGDARMVSANYSPGVEVKIGWPARLREPGARQTLARRWV